MKIALDISPLTNGHKYRGTGFYVKHLVDAFTTYYASQHEFIFFTDTRQIPDAIDIIHYPYFDPFSFSVPLFPKQKTIITVLDLTPILFSKHFPAGIKGTLLWQLEKFALSHVSGIITDSNSAKKDIQHVVGIPSEKTTTVYLAAGENFKEIHDKNALQNVQKKYQLPEKFALYVGDVTWNKNVPNIVRAAIASNIPLVMAGKALVNENYDKNNVWNADLISVQLLAKNTSNIIRLGFVPDEDLVALYNLATVFVMPSLYEGFGLPILEAMRCGCPVITSNEGSLPEVAGESAYVVDAKNKDSIALGIQEVFHNQTLQKKLSEKGLEQAKKFSWRKTAQETILAYEKLL